VPCRFYLRITMSENNRRVFQRTSPVGSDTFPNEAGVVHRDATVFADPR
jgi:hypothetical protein